MSSKKDNKEENDLGFGVSLSKNTPRLLNKDGNFNVIRRGIQDHGHYQQLLEMPWYKFIGLTVASFVFINCFFALLFVLNGVEQISGITPSSFQHDFIQSFFLSVQTFTSVGYGTLSPIGITANIIASACALVGLIVFAMATGLFFARFSKPKAQILYSDQAIITPYRNGVDSLQFRIANLRNNKLIDVHAIVNTSWIESVDGQLKRRFSELELEREHLVLFPLNWTIVHPITTKSPFYNKSPKDIKAMKVEVLVLIQGYDETYAQTIHSNQSYLNNEILFNVKFVKMYYAKKEGTVLELDKISTVVDL